MDRIPPTPYELQLTKPPKATLQPTTATRSPHTWHVALCFATLDPLAALISPVVLVSQDHIHVHVIVDGRIQTADVEAQEWEHPPEKTHKGTMIGTLVFAPEWTSGFTFFLLK